MLSASWPFCAICGVDLPSRTAATWTEAEALLDARHARADLLRQDQRIVDALDLAEADVAGAAVGALVGLAEVLDERLVPALEGAGVALHLAQVGDVGARSARPTAP